MANIVFILSLNVQSQDPDGSFLARVSALFLGVSGYLKGPKGMPEVKNTHLVSIQIAIVFMVDTL